MNSGFKSTACSYTSTNALPFSPGTCRVELHDDILCFISFKISLENNCADLTELVALMFVYVCLVLG